MFWGKSAIYSRNIAILLTKIMRLLLSLRCFIAKIRATAEGLVASQPIPHTVSVGYSITPPAFNISVICW